MKTPPAPSRPSAAPARARPWPTAFKALLLGPAPKAPVLGRPPLARADAKATAHPAERATRGHGRAPDREREKEEEPKRERGRPAAPADPLDPATRVAAQLAPPLQQVSAAPPAEQVTARARVSLEELVPQVLRRIAWGGDRVKGAVHLELVSGDRVTVHAEGRRVRVEVDGNADLERRIESRLRAAGIEVEGVR